MPLRLICSIAATDVWPADSVMVVTGALDDVCTGSLVAEAAASGETVSEVMVGSGR